MKRQLHLNLFIHSRGHHEASWRHPASSPLPLTDIRYYQDLAQRAEAGAVRFDLPRRPAGAGRRRGAGAAHLARADHRTGGAGGGDQPGRADRHRLDHLHRALQPRAPVRLDRPHQQRPRRLEHRDLLARHRGAQLRRRRPGEPCRPLRPRRGVHGGRQGAVGQLGRRCGHRRPRRRASMRARDRIRPINHRGDFYKVAGPLNMPRCPQGRPVLVQAGSSDTGRRFAARHAEAVFTAHMAKATAQEFYADLKGLAAAEGRAARAGADPARPQPDDRRRRKPRRSAWRARSTS